MYHPLDTQWARMHRINIAAVMAEITPEAKGGDFVPAVAFRNNPEHYRDRFYIQQRLGTTGRDLSYRTNNQHLEEMVEVLMMGYLQISCWPRPTMYHYSEQSLNEERAEIIEIFEAWFPCTTHLIPKS